MPPRRRTSVPLDRKSREELEEIQRILTKYARLPEWDSIIRKELAKIEGPATAKLKSKIRGIPSRVRNRGSRGGRQTSLRSEMIRAVKFNVDTSAQYTGAFIFLDAREMPEGRENLPAYMEGVRYYTRWRHPVFGDYDNWVTQKRHPYFYRTLRPFEVKTAKAAEEAIKAIRKDLGA
jgi:hypothetical protein